MRDIERVHLNQGWAIFGYNYAVAQDGQVLEGCGRDTRGIHSPPRNTDGIGVVFLQPSTAAGVPTAPMSAAMRNSGRWLYDTLCQQAGRRLTMSWHGADFATACPGPDVRAWVQGGMQASGVPTPGPVQPTPPQGELSVSDVNRILQRLDQLEARIQNSNAGFVSVRSANNVVWGLSGAGRFVIHPPTSSSVNAGGFLNISRILGLVGPASHSAPRIDDDFIRQFPIITANSPGITGHERGGLG
jgi:hypothetical protein